MCRLILLSEAYVLSGTITETLNFSFTASFFPFVYLTIQRFVLFSVTFHLTILSGWMRLVITESIRDWYIRHSLGTTASLLLYSCTSEDAGPSPVLWHHSRRHQQCLDQPSGTQGRGGNATTSESQENLGAKSIPYFCSLSFDSQHFPVGFAKCFFSGHYLQILWYYLWMLHSLVISALWDKQHRVCFHHKQPTQFVK